MAVQGLKARKDALDLLKMEVEEIEYKLRLRKATDEWNALQKADKRARQARLEAKALATKQA